MPNRLRQEKVWCLSRCFQADPFGSQAMRSRADLLSGRCVAIDPSACLFPSNRRRLRELGGLKTYDHIHGPSASAPELVRRLGAHRTRRSIDVGSQALVNTEAIR